MAGATTPNRAILLISMTAVSIARWRQSPACPHRKPRLNLPTSVARRRGWRERDRIRRSERFFHHELARAMVRPICCWIRGLFNTLRPAMKPGYENFMSGDEQHRVQEAYQERWDRIVAVKTHYDPNSFFRLNQNVPPKKLAMTLPASHGET